MRKEEFLKELEALLQDISEQERAEAMQYYTDYFDDAGSDKEEQIIEELGSPQKVAKTIQAGLGETDGEFSERGYRDQRFEQNQELGPRAVSAKGQQGARSGQTPAPKKKSNGWKIACIILLCLFFAPIILPVGIAAAAVLFAFLICLVALAVAVGATALGLLVAGVAIVVVGLVKAFMMPAAGVALAGVGFLILALGILAAVVITWCCVKFLPWLIRGIVKLLKYPFRNREEAA